MKIRILLAEDHRIVRQGLCSLIEKEPDLEVVAEASDGRCAVDLVDTHQPDVVVMGISMCKLNGVEATRLIRRDFPDVQILGLSMHRGRQHVTQMLKAGASGYLLKTCSCEELVNAIRVVCAGRVYLSPEIAGNIVEDYVSRIENQEIPPNAALTSREREVLQLVAEGLITKEIARVLHITVKTVEGHRHSIMQKLDLHSVAELTKYAIREGLTPLA